MRQMLVVLIGLYLIISGCKNNDEDKLIACNGPQQIKMISDMESANTNTGSKFSSHWFDISKSHYTLDSVRTLDQDKKKAHCESLLHTKTGLSEDGKYSIARGWAEQNGLLRMLMTFDRDREISYTIRITDDGNKMYLEDTSGFIKKDE